MESTLKAETISDITWKKLSLTPVTEWMLTPPLYATPEVSLRELLNDFLLRHAIPEVPIAATDGALLGIGVMEDVLARPRGTWDKIRSAEIMRNVNLKAILKPDETLEVAVQMLADDDEIRIIPIVAGGMLVGELRRADVLARLAAEQEDRLIRLLIEHPVLRCDGTRIGRVSAMVVDPINLQCSLLGVRLDGPYGMEVALSADFVDNWSNASIGTLLREEDVAALSDFAPYRFTPRMPRDAEQPAPEPIDLPVCLDNHTRLWAGLKCLGRVTDFQIDRENLELMKIGYASGLVFRTQHHLPTTAVLSLSPTRINVDGTKIS